MKTSKFNFFFIRINPKLAGTPCIYLSYVILICFIFTLCSHCYATLLRQYCNIVRQETKDTVGPMFKVVNKSTGKMTQSTLGLASMKYISVEVATIIGLLNPHLYTSKFYLVKYK